MTVREVAAALGVTDRTVQRDTVGVTNVAPDDDPDEVLDAEIVDDEDNPWADAPEAEPAEADDTPPPPHAPGRSP